MTYQSSPATLPARSAAVAVVPPDGHTIHQDEEVKPVNQRTTALAWGANLLYPDIIGWEYLGKDNVAEYGPASSEGAIDWEEHEPHEYPVWA
jgi:hypothetical protein